jgi:DNA repair protein RecO (recombination protein O)
VNFGGWDIQEGDTIAVDFLTQGLFSSSGIVLRRTISAEGDMSLQLFLKKIGPVWAQAPGSARGRVRFGGATEPLTWGSFNLYKGPKRFYVKSIDIKDDMWKLRLDAQKLSVGLQWNRLIARYTCSGIAEDSLLALLYWTMRSLSDGVDPLLLSWRLLWRWLHIRGEAPDLFSCEQCGKELTSEAFWSETGLLCSRCSNKVGGVVPYNDLKALQVAALISRKSLPAQEFSMEGVFLKAQIERLKFLLEKNN